MSCFPSSSGMLLGSPESSIGSLPILIKRHNKVAWGVALALLNAGLYMGANHFHIFEPQLLHMTWIDRVTPFLPHTVWIYGTEYFLFLAVYWLLEEEVNVNRYAYAFLAQQLFAVAVFMAWPTTYPREFFPLPMSLDAFTFQAFSSLRASDTPASCCPSLHVSSVYLSAFMLLHEKREKFPFFFVWATAVAASTLTTKQHYLIDVVSGFVVAIVFSWIFSTRVRYRITE